MSERAHIAELIERYLAGLITEPELAEFEQALTHDPDGARLFAEVAREEERLHAYFGQRRDTAALQLILQATQRPTNTHPLPAARRSSLGY